MTTPISKQAHAAVAFENIESFLARVVKTAEGEGAAADPGSIGGATTHPVKSAPNHTIPEQTGARAAENEKDVKADQGAPSVNSTKDATAKAGDDGRIGQPGTATADIVNAGTMKVRPTGEDPENETGKAKGGKEDPGSTHPARTDNDALNGGKYAADELEQMPMDKLAALISETGNDICVGFVNAGVEAQKQGSAQQPNPATAQQTNWAPTAAGSPTFDKQAADQIVRGTLAQIIKVAQDQADSTVRYLNEYSQAQAQAQQQQATLRKQGDGPPPPDGGAGGPPPDMGAGGPPPGMGAGGPPPGADPTGGGGGGGQEQEMAQLLAMLEQLPPEEQQQILQAIEAEMSGGGGASGPPPGADPAAGGGGAGGPPPGADPAAAAAGAGGGAGPMPPPGGMQVSASDKHAVSKQAVMQVTGYVKELIGRSKIAKAAAAVQKPAA